MGKKSYINKREFCRLNDIEPTTLNYRLCVDTDLDEMNTNKTMIDEMFFIRRVAFRKKVWLLSHDMYFELSEHKADVDIAKILARYTDRSIGTWSMFLSTKLFSNDMDKSILDYKINSMNWEFFRIARALTRTIKRKW